MAGRPDRKIVRLLEPILRHLEESLEPLSANDICRETTGAKAAILGGLEWLGAAGYVRYTLGSRGARLYEPTDSGKIKLIQIKGSLTLESVS